MGMLGIDQVVYVASISKQNGYGSPVISKLIKAGLKKNLYYEIKDVVVEERQDGVHAYKQKVRTKVFGLNSTKDVRKQLIDLLIDRVENHKDKFISPIIYNELLGMEIKRSGKVEHSDSTHDDQVFSMLMALWVWYEGTNLAERYGIRKTSIKTDDEVDEQIDLSDDGVEIVEYFNTKDEEEEEIEKDLEAAKKALGTPLDEFLNKRHEEEAAIFRRFIMTPLGERAYRQTYGIPDTEPIEKYIRLEPGDHNIPDSVFDTFYQPDDGFFNNDGTESSNVSAVPASQAYILNDESYNYAKHFNF